MIKKIVVILLACTFLLISLAACGGANDSGSSSQISESVSSEESVSSSETADLGVFEGFIKEPGDIDLGGASVVVAFIIDEEPKLGVSDDGDKIYNRRKMAEDKYNFKFEYKVVGGQAYGDIFASSSAAGIFFADIIIALPTKNQFSAPIDEVIDFSSEKYSPQENITKWIDGKHYFILHSTSQKNVPVVAYNPDLLEREGAPDPLILAQEGKWDWDALLNIAEMTTKNIGEANAQYGLKGWFVNALLQANGVSQVKVADGKLESGLLEPAALTALNFYRTLLVERKVVDPADWSIGNQNFINGTNAMIITEGWQIAGLRDYMDNFEVVPLPFGPDNEEMLVPTRGLGGNGRAFTLLSDIPVEDRVAIWIDATANNYRGDPETFIDEYDNYINSGATQSIFNSDEAREYYWDINIDSVFTLDLGMSEQIMWDNFVSGGSPIAEGENPSTVIEAMKNEVYAYLETLIQD